MAVAEEDRKQVPAGKKMELAEEQNTDKQMAEDLERQEGLLEKHIGCNILRRKSLFLIHYQIRYKAKPVPVHRKLNTETCV